MILGSMNDRLVTFPDSTVWQLKKKICEKPWEGSSTRQKINSWQPSEAHAVYECVQTQGPQPGSETIMKIRIE